MGISKTTLLNETTKALAKQTEYNKEIFALKGEAGGGGGTTDLNITVGNVQPVTGLWFNTYTTFYSTNGTQTYTTQQTYTTSSTNPTTEPSQPTNIGIDQYTKVMLHFDESATKDECGNTWTATGSPSLSSSPAKFGKALQLNGSSQYLETSNTFSIGSQDWTLDFWIYRNSSSNGYDQICDTASSNGLNIMIRPSNISVERANSSQVANFSYTLPFDAWHHVAIVRDGNNFYLFVDGTKQGTETDSNAFGNSFTRIGRAVAEAATATYLDGYLDEFRFSLGIARWAEDFTPPTAPYGGVN